MRRSHSILNVIDIRQGKWAQNWFSAAKILGLLLVVIVGLMFASSATMANSEAVAAELMRPTVGMLLTAAENHDDRPFLLIYASKTWSEVTFREELEELKTQRMAKNT